MNALRTERPKVSMFELDQFAWSNPPDDPLNPDAKGSCLAGKDAEHIFRIVFPAQDQQFLPCPAFFHGHWTEIGFKSAHCKKLVLYVCENRGRHIIDRC